MVKASLLRFFFAGIVGFTLAVADPATPAQAHPEVSPQTVNRYVAVMVDTRKIHVILSLLWGEVPGGDQRLGMDSNHDGNISDQELAAERDRWRDRADQFIRLKIDGKDAPFDPEINIDLGGRKQVAPQNLVIEVAGIVEIGSLQAHTIFVQAIGPLPRLGETEISIDPTAEWSLKAGFAGESGGPEEPKTQFKWPPGSLGNGAASATFVIEPAVTKKPEPGSPTTGRDRSQNSLSPALKITATLCAVSAAALAFRIRQRRRRRKDAAE